MNDIEKTKKLLHSGGYTCVLCRNDRVVTSVARGVKPLVAWLAAGEDFAAFSAADKVVGRATAFLYVLLGVKAVYGDVISRAALAVLTAHGIAVEYGILTDHIINRCGDGICPFEAAVLAVDEPQEALRIIRAKMDELHITL